MYKTTDDYKKNVYTCKQHELNIYIDGQKVNDSYILDFNPKYELIDNKIELGSTPMQEIELKLHKNAVFKTCKEIYVESGIFKGEIVPVGYFTTKEINDENEYTTRIVAYDYMDKFEFNFDGSKYIPCTTGVLLQKMCDEAGVELASKTFLNSDVLISVYDNTITARKFISMIAEQAGGFAHIGRDGKLYIKHIENTSYTNNYDEKTFIDIETSINSTASVFKIKGNENGLSNTIDLYIDAVEKSVYLVDLFRQIYVQLLNGNINISLPKELKNIVDYSLDDKGNLVAYIYDIYKNKLDFSMDISGTLLVDVNPDSRIIISRNKITIDLDNITLKESDYIYYNFNSQKWYLYQNTTSVEITNLTVLNSLNQLLNITLPKGNVEIYLDNEVSAISLNCTNYIEIPIELFKEFEFSKEVFECTRLYYEDGIRSFDYGKQTGNTIYINPDNMFIVDDGDNTSSQLQKVFNKVNGLKLRGFKGTSIIDIAIDIGDVVFIDGEPVLYQGTWEYQGRNTATISSMIQSKSKEESTSNKVSTDVKIRRIQSNINQIEGNITLLGEEVSEAKENISKLEIKSNQISSIVSEKLDLINSVGGSTPIKLENCIAGELQYLSIKGSAFKTGSNLYVHSENLKENFSYGYIDSSGTFYLDEYENNGVVIIPVEKNTNYYIEKIRGGVFRVALFSDTLEDARESTQFIKDCVQKGEKDYIEIKTSSKDKYLAINFWNSELDVETLNEIYTTLLIYSYNRTIDLNVKNPLNVLELEDETVFDEFIYDASVDIKKETKAKVIRNIGVDNEGNLYKLSEPTIERIETDDILIGTPTNILELDDIVYLKADYIILNDFTKFFTTTYEVMSAIEQLANQISLSVKYADLISSINIAIKNDEATIEVVTGGMEINTTYFYMSKDGKIKIKSSQKYYQYTDLDLNLIGAYISGKINLPKELLKIYDYNGDGVVNVTDMVAIKNVVEGIIESTKIINTNLNLDATTPDNVVNINCDYENLETKIGLFQIFSYLLKTSLLLIGEGYSEDVSENFYGIQLNGEKKNIKITDTDNIVGTEVNASKVDTYDVYAGNGNAKGKCMHSPDVDFGGNNHNYLCHYTGNALVFNIDPSSNADFNVGPFWINTGTSDMRLKHNESKIDDNLLKVIDKTKLIEFTFNNDDKDKKRIGVIAQDFLKLCKEYNVNIYDYDIVKYGIKFKDDKKSYLGIDYEQLQLLKIKCLENKIKKLEDKINTE